MARARGATAGHTEWQSGGGRGRCGCTVAGCERCGRRADLAVRHWSSSQVAGRSRRREAQGQWRPAGGGAAALEDGGAAAVPRRVTPGGRAAASVVATAARRLAAAGVRMETAEQRWPRSKRPARRSTGDGARVGLAVAGVALSVVAAVNAHHLAAHLAGVNCCLGLVRFDSQLGLVELLVPGTAEAGEEEQRPGGRGDRAPDAEPGGVQAQEVEVDGTDAKAREDLLLPYNADGLHRPVRRSIHRPPPWTPDSMVDDFIQIRLRC